jgi:hypothetical protein
MNKITLILFALIAIISCSTRKNSFISEEEILIFKEIKANDSIFDNGEVNLYKHFILIQGNKLRYALGKDNGCTNLNYKLDTKTNYLLKADSIFFKFNRKQKNGLLIRYKANGVIKNDSLIIDKYIESSIINEYDFAETLILKRCN